MGASVQHCMPAVTRIGWPVPDQHWSSDYIVHTTDEAGREARLSKHKSRKMLCPNDDSLYTSKKPSVIDNYFHFVFTVRDA